MGNLCTIGWMLHFVCVLPFWCEFGLKTLSYFCLLHFVLVCFWSYMSVDIHEHIVFDSKSFLRSLFWRGFFFFLHCTSSVLILLFSALNPQDYINEPWKERKKWGGTEVWLIRFLTNISVSYNPCAILSATNPLTHTFLSICVLLY